MNPWIALVLFLIGNGIMGAALMMLIKGTYPPPFTARKANPAVATFVMLLGLTMMLHFGVPRLLVMLIEDVGKRLS